MIQTVLKQGVSWEAMPPSRTRALIDRGSLIEGLAELRRELEQGNSDLATMQVSAGFLLADLCDQVGLDPQERRQVLGAALDKATR